MTTLRGDANRIGASADGTQAWRLHKDTFSVYGSGGEVLWSAHPVREFRVSSDGRTAVLAKHIDPEGGKRRRNYAAVYRDGAAVFEFFEAPMAMFSRGEEFPAYISKNGRFGWVKKSRAVHFFDAHARRQAAVEIDGFPEIDETGAYKVYGMKFGDSYTMLRKEGRLE